MTTSCCTPPPLLFPLLAHSFHFHRRQNQNRVIIKPRPVFFTWHWPKPRLSRPRLELIWQDVGVSRKKRKQCATHAKVGRGWLKMRGGVEGGWSASPSFRFSSLSFLSPLCCSSSSQSLLLLRGLDHQLQALLLKSHWDSLLFIFPLRQAGVLSLRHFHQNPRFLD